MTSRPAGHLTVLEPSLAPPSAEAGLPAAPTHELRAAVRAAGLRAAQLAAAGREIHFAVPPGGGRIAIEVRSVHGEPRRTLTPSRMLAIVEGWLEP